jgi:hypothetical protein
MLGRCQALVLFDGIGRLGMADTWMKNLFVANVWLWVWVIVWMYSNTWLDVGGRLPSHIETVHLYSSG